MSSPSFGILVTKILMILQKCHERGWKIRILEKMTAAPFQLKITLDTDDAISVDLQNDLNNCKGGKFEYF